MLSMKDWEAWVKAHKYPALARRVFTWLEETDQDEELWQQADNLVDLLARTLVDHDQEPC